MPSTPTAYKTTATMPKWASNSLAQADALAEAATVLVGLYRKATHPAAAEALSHEAARMREQAEEFYRDAEPTGYTYSEGGERVPFWTVR